MTFELWPAIDLWDGRCVRLRQGSFSAETVYGDPVEQAEAFVAAGARGLHVVDLDAAREGGAPNRDIVLAIASRTGVPVQVGGGVRGEAAAAALLEEGVARVVVGTLAVEKPELLTRVASRWPGRVMVGLDHRQVAGSDGTFRREVAVRGWLAQAGLELRAALARLEGIDLGGVVVTDIDRDGTGDGPDLEGLSDVLGATALPVLASGGVATGADIAALAGLEVNGRRLAGVIVGRALLSGKLSIEEAVAACRR